VKENQDSQQRSVFVAVAQGVISQSMDSTYADNASVKTQIHSDLNNTGKQDDTK
jgi:hypothetical protein